MKEILERSPVFSSITSCQAKMSILMIISDTNLFMIVSSTLYLLFFNQILAVVSPRVQLSDLSAKRVCEGFCIIGKPSWSASWLVTNELV